MQTQKGVIDIEYIIAIVVFLSVITFVSYFIIGNVPVFHKESISEDLRTRTYQASQLLLFDQGEPTDWNSATLMRIGLSTGEAYKISSTKISNLAAVCTDYNRLKSFLVQDFRNDIRISITNQFGVPLVNCGPAINTTVIPEFPITRYAVLEDDTIVKITVTTI